MIAIVDYGVGNLFSLLSSLRALDLEAEVTGDAGRLRAADRIILPGVGAFGDARAKLDATGLVPVIQEEAEKKPLLGICRGIQILNVYFGGTLFQDLPSQHPHGIDHHMTPPYDRAVHTVSLVPGTPLQTVLKKDELGVNSYHHQAIRRLAPRLEVMAIAEDGIIESVYLPDYRFVWGMQWHPELNFQKDASSRRIFGAFASACKASRRCRERSASGKRREALPA